MQFWSTLFLGTKVSFCLPSANFLFILSLFLHLHFRLQPSTISTFWPPRCDSQAPSDSDLLHHQQRRSPGRVSEKRTTKLSSLKSLFFMCVRFNHIWCNTLVLSSEQRTSNPVERWLMVFPRPFYCPLKGKWLWTFGGEKITGLSDVID